MNPKLLAPLVIIAITLVGVVILKATAPELARVEPERAIARFRPIALTTGTTFLGLVPLMFEAAIPATPLIPMAIALAYGALYASTMTLFLVPVGYLMVHDLTATSRRISLDAGADVPTI